MIAAGIYLALGAAEAARLAETSFERSLEGLPPEEARRQRERREDQRAADRRNRELCEAIRSTRPRGLGVFW